MLIHLQVSIFIVTFAVGLQKLAREERVESSEHSEKYI